MSIKIKSISGFNFAKYQNIMININPAATYLVGPNRSGKTTVGLDLIWFVMQGIAENARDGKIPLIGDRFRFIGNDGATALAELVLYDSKAGHDIRVIRKLLKNSTELSFSAPAGLELKQAWLNDLFNIFLISPKRFIDLPSLEQSKALGIDTKIWDDEIARLKEDFTKHNRELSKYDNLAEVALVKRPDMEALAREKAGIKEKLANDLTSIKNGNLALKTAWEEKKREIDNEAAEYNKNMTELRQGYNLASDAIQYLRDEGRPAGFFLTAADADDASYPDHHDPLQAFLDYIKQNIKPDMVAADHYPAVPEYKAEEVDETPLTEIDAKIVTAAGEGERALLYEQYVEKLRLKGLAELAVQENKTLQAKQYAARLEYIKAFKFPFSKLSVDDEGGLLLNDKPLKPAYFSTGELIKIIPMLIASRNPDFKYVFIQEANLLDDENLEAIEKELTGQGFQIVFEYVGTEKLEDKNCILLKNRKVIDGLPAGKFLQDSENNILGLVTDHISEAAAEIENDNAENQQDGK